MNLSCKQNSWQRQRNRVNHDWLKNSFIIQLSALLNLASDECSSSGEVRDACESVRGEWTAWRLVIQELVRSYSKLERPSQFFLSPPLSACDDETMTWLPAFVDERWLKANSVSDLVKVAERHWENTDRLASEFSFALESYRVQRQPLIRSIERYLDAVSQLSAAISKFPTRPAF